MKKILKLLKNIFLTKTPIYVIFFVTSHCNARCKMCFNWKNIENAQSMQQLQLAEIKKIFSNFSSIQQLTISGGEPFLRRDLPEILEFVSHKNDVQIITIPTNGILSDIIFTQTKNILHKIKKDTHLRIGLSVEGVGEKHDEIVQVKGAFNKILDTYQKLTSLKESHNNFNIDISICCSVFNKEFIKGTIEYCNNNFKDCSIHVSLARGDTRDISSKNVTPAEYKEITDYLNQLKDIKKINKPFAKIFNVLSKIVSNQVITVMQTKKMPNPCYVYSKMIVLQSNGEVFPCEYLNRKLGNLRENNYDIKQILNNKNNKKIEKFIGDGRCYCTWECALSNNIVCNPREYPYFFNEMLKEFFKH